MRECKVISKKHRSIKKVAIFIAVTLIAITMVACNQDKQSAQDDKKLAQLTEKQLQALKFALFKYEKHMGFLPFKGKNPGDKSAYEMTPSAGFGTKKILNCLFRENIEGFDYLGMTKGKYAKRWKGPYIKPNNDPFPNKEILDGWNNPFRFLFHDKMFIIWSPGKDGKFGYLKAVISGKFKDPDRADYIDDLFLAVKFMHKWPPSDSLRK
jgi:hypothetical protein